MSDYGFPDQTGDTSYDDGPQAIFSSSDEQLDPGELLVVMVSLRCVLGAQEADTSLPRLLN